jgi:hypothetical protein
MDWFERLTGFREMDYRTTQKRLRIEDGHLRSDASDASYGIGALELVSLDELRRRRIALPGRLRVSLLSADARELHRRETSAWALFQVASQFNLLEMTGPGVTPERGVGIYEHDRTQGPACAIAAGAATIYRNYFAPVGDQIGQTARKQLDGLADVGAALAQMTDLPVSALWAMENGYALPSELGLAAVGHALSTASEAEFDRMRGLLRVGLHADVEVTDDPQHSRQRVSQVFCSALPIGYSRLKAKEWEPFARLVLEAAYEATLYCAVENAARTGCRTVYLTLIGAGAFENPSAWVLDAARRALDIFRDTSLNVTFVSYGSPPSELVKLAAGYEALA